MKDAEGPTGTPPDKLLDFLPPVINMFLKAGDKMDSFFQIPHLTLFANLFELLFSNFFYILSAPDRPQLVFMLLCDTALSYIYIM